MFVARQSARLFPSAISRYLVSNAHIISCRKSAEKFPSAISRYLVSNAVFLLWLGGKLLGFPSAISRYLVSNNTLFFLLAFWFVVSIRYIAVLGFQLDALMADVPAERVSIRYIAVLGFQRAGRQTYVLDNRFPSAISRYLVSNCLSKSSRFYLGLCFHPLYRGTWFPTLPEKHPF